jgi:hypothetical protein
MPHKITSANGFRQKENILINCICPGLVPTKLIGKAVDSIPADCLTPISTIVEAYADFLSDENSLTGQAMECSVQKRILIPQTPFLNGWPSERSSTTWEPSFKLLHHENSDLESAIP